MDEIMLSWLQHWFFIFILLSDLLGTRYSCAIFQSQFHYVASTTMQTFSSYVARLCSFYLEIISKSILIAFPCPHFSFPLQIHTSIPRQRRASRTTPSNNSLKRKMCYYVKKMFFILEIWS